MKNKTKYSSFYKFIVYTFSFTFLGLIFIGCSSSSTMRVSEYKFTYEGQNYLLRSAYCPHNPKSCNQIICKDFVANDLNQDTIIDEVINSDIPIAKVQKIYDFCLNTLEKQGKVNQIDIDNHIFIYNENNFVFEIKTFSLGADNNFNQFTIKEKLSFNKTNTAVFIDKKADGTLDEILKGNFNITEAQKKYKSTIERGLMLGSLKKTNGVITYK